MTDNTKIEWTDATANYVNGCDIVSPGCTNCYAMRSGGRNLPGHPSTGLTKPSKAGHVWTGEVRRNDKILHDVLRWKRPRRIFWNAHGDLFHPAVPDEWIDAAFAVMALTPHHTHQVLTKRPERMREYCKTLGRHHEVDRVSIAAKAINQKTGFAYTLGDNGWHLPNVWLGTSVEDQTRADERIPHLLATPAAIRFISAEPLLGPVDLNRIRWPDGESGIVSALTGHWASWPIIQRGGRASLIRADDLPKLNWVIVGGESGPGARPMHPDWARSLRDQCAATGVQFHFKQWGAWLPSGQIATQTGLWNPLCGSSMLTTKKNAGRLLDGHLHDGFPA